MTLKPRLIIYLICFISLLFSNNYTYKDIPIQESGRIKPLSTYAENQLLVLYGKRSFKTDSTKVKAIDWLIDLISNPNARNEQKVFYLSSWENSPNVEITLGLNSDNHYYSNKEIFESLKKNQDLVVSLLNSPSEELSYEDEQIVNIYKKWELYDYVSNGVAVYLPVIDINNNLIKDFLDINNDKVSYSYFVRNFDKFEFLFNDLSKASENIKQDIPVEKEHEYYMKIYDIHNSIMNFEDILKTSITLNQNFKIIPSMHNDESGEWLTPVESVLINRSPMQDTLMLYYENYFKAYLDNNFNLMNESANDIINLVSDMDDSVNPKLLAKETKYNNLNLFTISMLLYIFSFCVMGISWMFNSVSIKGRYVAFILLLLGFIIHAYGLSLRMIIMQRPPVSTLYESIIFVNFVLVFFAIIFEHYRKDSLGILVAAVGGVILHFIGLKYAADGDTLGMLVAVLNSNFWLAIHVTTITIGYGISLVAGLMAHVYLLFYIFNSKNKDQLNKIYNNVYGLTLMALFFTMFGTILGGIWADQSWGRFWGWDPKENGALLIVLWHLMMLHMRISGMVKQVGFSLGISLINIVVAIAWFGVNLLNVGLHSYGFTDNVAINLFMFIFLELFFVICIYFIIKEKVIEVFNFAYNTCKNFSTIDVDTKSNVSSTVGKKENKYSLSKFLENVFTFIFIELVLITSIYFIIKNRIKKKDK